MAKKSNNGKQTRKTPFIPFEDIFDSALTLQYGFNNFEEYVRDDFLNKNPRALLDRIYLPEEIQTILDDVISFYNAHNEQRKEVINYGQTEYMTWTRHLMYYGAIRQLKTAAHSMEDLFFDKDLETNIISRSAAILQGIKAARQAGELTGLITAMGTPDNNDHELMEIDIAATTIDILLLYAKKNISQFKIMYRGMANTCIERKRGYMTPLDIRAVEKSHDQRVDIKNQTTLTYTFPCLHTKIEALKEAYHLAEHRKNKKEIRHFICEQRDGLYEKALYAHLNPDKSVFVIR